MIKDFTELRIYQIALQLAQDINGLIHGIPFFWDVPESDQILRSSSSVPSNIAEGFGSRFYQKQFIHYLNIALDSGDETRNHLILLYKKNYISDVHYDFYSKGYKDLSIRILNFINYLKNKNIKK